MYVAKYNFCCFLYFTKYAHLAKKHLKNAAYSTATLFTSEPEAVVIVTNSK